MEEGDYVIPSGPLTQPQIAAIKALAIETIGRQVPLARQILEAKVVCNPRKNFLNFTIRKDYMGMCYYEEINGTHYCYFISDRLEPFVIITAVDPAFGKLECLSRTQVDDLARSLLDFKIRFGICKETYHYTPLKERRETGGGPPETKSHFHLKVRVATEMIVARMPVYQLIDIGRLRSAVKPVRYNFSRETKTWEETYPLLLNDAI
jgi:hypothetical protein